MRADGTNNKPIPSLTDVQYGLSWSPDGEWIIGVGLLGVTMFSVERNMMLPLPFRGPSGGELNQPSWSPR